MKQFRFVRQYTQGGVGVLGLYSVVIDADGKPDPMWTNSSPIVANDPIGYMAAINAAMQEAIRQPVLESADTDWPPVQYVIAPSTGADGVQA